MVDWTREKSKMQQFSDSKIVKSLNLFVTGGAGIGKARLIETCHAFLTKPFSSHADSPENVQFR